MHIAIDDTYGPGDKNKSKYVTGQRRTHVAVIFPDEDVSFIRQQMKNCLTEINKQLGRAATEFHFVDIYNRKSPWNKLKGDKNLEIFEVFAEIYRRYKWPVFIQTVDKRTLADHELELAGVIDGYDLSNPSDLSLFFLLVKIKNKYKINPVPINIFLDEGKRKPGAIFEASVFHDWPEKVYGKYESSSSEPLLQIADFIAYCVNRCTHLSVKENRTEIDNYFLNLVGSMGINSDDIIYFASQENFTIKDFDNLHIIDRKRKGLEG